MKIRSVSYAGTIAQPGGSPPEPSHLPQVAFSGRSNVGKSSLINVLLGRTRSKIAHVSQTPGKTRTLNFFDVNGDFFLVDLPGYGYAKVPESVRDSWRRLMEWYLGESGMVAGVVHLVDARHPPTRDDRQMVAYLASLRLPTLVALTKMDKLKRSQRRPALERAREALEVEAEQLVPFSAKTGEGRGELLAALADLIGGAGAEDGA